jgi:hypothetical protein
MDKNGIELKELDIVSNETADDQLMDLLESQQKDCIERINIRSFKGGDNIFDRLHYFPNLKQLDVKSTGRITLDKGLKKLKNLESLVLSSCDVCLDVEDHQETAMELLKLKSLVLEKVMIINDNNEDDLFGFLPKCCPNLSTLSIQGQVLDTSKKPFKVHFDEHYFTSIKVYILGNTWYKVNNHTWYKFSGKTLLQQEQKGDEEEFYVSIVYKGLTSLNIGGTLIPNWSSP